MRFDRFDRLAACRMRDELHQLGAEADPERRLGRVAEAKRKRGCGFRMCLWCALRASLASYFATQYAADGTGQAGEGLAQNLQPGVSSFVGFDGFETSGFQRQGADVFPGGATWRWQPASRFAPSPGAGALAGPPPVAPSLSPGLVPGSSLSA